jgi:hypothetical protein
MCRERESSKSALVTSTEMTKGPLMQNMLALLLKDTSSLDIDIEPLFLIRPLLRNDLRSSYQLQDFP